MPSIKNGKVALKLQAASTETEQRNAPPRRRPNKEVRVREYLTEAECRALITTARKRGGRYGLRDALAIRMCWRHGLRVSELCGLRWDHVEWKTARLTVHRAKGSVDSTHPMSGDELRALQRNQEAGCRFIGHTHKAGSRARPRRPRAGCVSAGEPALWV